MKVCVLLVLSTKYIAWPVQAAAAAVALVLVVVVQRVRAAAVVAKAAVAVAVVSVCGRAVQPAARHKEVRRSHFAALPPPQQASTVRRVAEPECDQAFPSAPSQVPIRRLLETPIRDSPPPPFHLEHILPGGHFTCLKPHKFDTFQKDERFG